MQLKKKVGRPFGGIPWNKGMKGVYHLPHGRKHTNATKRKISKTQKKQYRTGERTSYQLGKPQYKVRDKNHWRYNGLTSKDQILRTRIEFKLWRDKVRKNSPNKCIVCGSKKFLIAHHIKSFKRFPLLRYDYKNGVVVCRVCHPSVHRYGLERMIKIGKVNLKRKCLTCKKVFSFTFNRIKTAYYCSKYCWYTRPTLKTKEQKIQYKKDWYRKNSKKILLK